MNEYTCPCCGEHFVDSGVTPTGIFALREDALFSSDNYWGIPNLDPAMIATPDLIPTETFAGDLKKAESSQGKTLYVYDSCKFPPIATGNVLGFYVDDSRFDHVWTDAVKTVDRLRTFGWGAVIAPNFSVWRDDPLAIQIHNVYRSRWIACYWQAAGIKVIPDLNWSDERSYDFAWLGIPERCPVVSVQVRTTRSQKGKDLFIESLGVAIEAIGPEHVIVYGEENRDWLEKRLPEGEYHWLPSFNSERKRLGLKNRK